MKVRLATLDDIAACNDLHNAAYRRRRTLEQWRWEFVPAIFNTDPLPFAVVDDGGRMVGTQAFIPMRMLDREGVYWTAKSEETLVDPEYRGQKLFERMYDLLFEYAAQNELRYIWGFTPATKAFRRLGFLTPRKTEQLFYPFSSRAVTSLTESGSLPSQPSLGSSVKQIAYRGALGVARLYSSAKSSGSDGRAERTAARLGCELRTLDTADSQAAEVCQRFVERWGGTTIYRDDQYLAWRLFGNPYLKAIVRGVYRDNRLLGWAAWSVGDEGMGYLVDLFVAAENDRVDDDEAIIGLLLSDTITSLCRTGAYGIRGWRVNNHPFDRRLTRAAGKLGFYHLKRGHTVVVRPDETTQGGLPDTWFDDWYVTRLFTEGRAG